MRVYDVTASEAVSCSFSARNEPGSSTSYSTDSSSYGLAQRHDTLVMNASLPPGNGTYALRCVMSTNNTNGYTKIFGYKIEE